jgi:hypothetical protein
VIYILSFSETDSCYTDLIPLISIHYMMNGMLHYLMNGMLHYGMLHYLMNGMLHYGMLHYLTMCRRFVLRVGLQTPNTKPAQIPNLCEYQTYTNTKTILQIYPVTF